MRRYTKPAAAALPPDVGVAAGAGRTVRLHIGGAGVNEREIAPDHDAHVLLADISHRRFPADLRQKTGAVDQSAVGIAVEKIVGEMGVEPADIGMFDRA